MTEVGQGRTTRPEPLLEFEENKRAKALKQRAPAICGGYGVLGPNESRRNMMVATHVGNIFEDGVTGWSTFHGRMTMRSCDLVVTAVNAL